MRQNCEFVGTKKERVAAVFFCCPIQLARPKPKSGKKHAYPAEDIWTEEKVKKRERDICAQSFKPSWD
jgi:hypothetical protein